MVPRRDTVKSVRIGLLYTIEYNSTSMSWYEDINSMIENYGKALDAFAVVFDERYLPDHLSGVQREAKERNRDAYLVLISHIQSEWKKHNPDHQDYFTRIHRRMAIVAEKIFDDSDPKVKDARIVSNLDDEETLRDRTYQHRMRERCQHVIRSLADVLEYAETRVPDEMREFLEGTDSSQRGPERGKY